jgi:hypothetical protein
MARTALKRFKLLGKGNRARERWGQRGFSPADAPTYLVRDAARNASEPAAG